MKRILIALLFLSQLAQAQTDNPNKYVFYRYEHGKRMHRVVADSAYYVPVIDTTWTPYRAGALTMRPQDTLTGVLHVFSGATTGKRWYQIAGSAASIDSFTYATRRYVDSSVSAKPTPSWDQTLAVSGTTTRNATTTGTITGATVQSTNGQAYLSNSLGFGTAGFRDADGVIATQITGFTDSSSSGRGKINTSVFTFKPMTNRLPNGASTTGYANLYYRAGAFRVSVDGVETDLGASGGGGASTTLSTLTYGATTTWNYATQGTAAKVTLTGNTTLSITNLPASVTYLTLEVVQDATGSRTITLPAGTKVIGGGAGAVTLTTTGGAIDILTFYYNGTTLYCNIGTNYN